MDGVNFHRHLIALFLVPLLLIEVSLNLFTKKNENQFSDLLDPLFKAQQSSNLIVIGSSRAATAIVPELLQSSLAKSGIISGNVYNLGMGYTRIAEYALALKKLEKSNPLALKNSLILIETIGALPSIDSWEDAWFHPSFPNFVLPYLGREDLLKLVDSKGIGIESKLFLVPAYYLALPGEILRSRAVLFDRGSQISEYLAALLDPNMDKPDIARAGGIRFDLAPGKIHEEDTRIQNCDLSHYQTIVDSPELLDNSIIKEISMIARRNNAAMQFFDVPLTPKEYLCSKLDIAKMAKVAVERKIDEWRVRVLPLDIIYSKEDFADAIHLKLSRSADFTNQLSEAITWKSR